MRARLRSPLPLILQGALLGALLAAAGPGHARPDLRQSRIAGPLVVYADDSRRGLHYYLPGDIEVALEADGRPIFHFLRTRYTGSVATADRGTRLFRSVLSFRVQMAGPSAADLRAANQALRAAGAPPGVELRPLPIRHLDAALVYVTAGPDSAGGDERALAGGHFEAGAQGDGTAGAYWRQRDYVIGLDPETAQLFWEALQAGQLVLSLGYAFYADGIPPDQPLAVMSGSPPLLRAIEHAAEGRPAGAASPSLIKAGSTAIRVDGRRWPGLFRQLDINESAPPGYPALDLYCYDFHDQLRPDLWEKQVEIEAEGVGGKPIRLLSLFRADRPDLYAQGLRFPLAVRLDRPYRYRVSEVGRDGSSVESAWRQRPSWTELLDVTSPAPSTAPTPAPEEP